MSTRATITVADERDSFHLYQHHDGYADGPHGLVRRIAMAQRLAWDLPRFEAPDFAAAIIAVLKDRGGSTYLAHDAEAHADRAYHYRIEPLRKGVSTYVQLTVTQPSWRCEEDDRELFKGNLVDAITKFDAMGETASQPREYQILLEAQGSLWRAQEEINALCGERPDPDTELVHEQIKDACRDLSALMRHLETMAPWDALKLTSNASVVAKLALQAHLRFQRDE